MRQVFQFLQSSKNSRPFSVYSSTFLALGFLFLFGLACSQSSKNYGVINESAEPIVIRFQKKLNFGFADDINPNDLKGEAKKIEARIRAGEVFSPHIYFGDPQNFNRNANFFQTWKAVDKDDWQLEFDEPIVSEDKQGWSLAYRLIINLPSQKAVIIERFAPPGGPIPHFESCCEQMPLEADKLIISGAAGEKVFDGDEAEEKFRFKRDVASSANFYFYTYE